MNVQNGVNIVITTLAMSLDQPEWITDSHISICHNSFLKNF